MDGAESIEEGKQGLLKHFIVVDAGTDNDLGMHLYPGLEQHIEPSQACSSARVPEQVRSDLWVRCVHRHIQRTQAFGHDALGIELGKPRQRGEVAIEK